MARYETQSYRIPNNNSTASSPRRPTSPRPLPSIQYVQTKRTWPPDRSMAQMTPASTNNRHSDTCSVTSVTNTTSSVTSTSSSCSASSSSGEEDNDNILDVAGGKSNSQLLHNLDNAAALVHHKLRQLHSSATALTQNVHPSSSSSPPHADHFRQIIENVDLIRASVKRLPDFTGRKTSPSMAQNSAAAVTEVRTSVTSINGSLTGVAVNGSGSGSPGLSSPEAGGPTPDVEDMQSATAACSTFDPLRLTWFSEEELNAKLDSLKREVAGLTEDKKVLTAKNQVLEAALATSAKAENETAAVIGRLTALHAVGNGGEPNGLDSDVHKLCNLSTLLGEENDRLRTQKREAEVELRKLKDGLASAEIKNQALEEELERVKVAAAVAEEEAAAKAVAPAAVVPEKESATPGVAMLHKLVQNIIAAEEAATSGGLGVSVGGSGLTVVGAMNGHVVAVDEEKQWLGEENARLEAELAETRRRLEDSEIRLMEAAAAKCEVLVTPPLTSTSPSTLPAAPMTALQREVADLHLEVQEMQRNNQRRPFLPAMDVMGSPQFACDVASLKVGMKESLDDMEEEVMRWKNVAAGLELAIRQARHVAEGVNVASVDDVSEEEGRYGDVFCGNMRSLHSNVRVVLWRMVGAAKCQVPASYGPYAVAASISLASLALLSYCKVVKQQQQFHH